jgi:phosphoribosylformylglycinamidine synthase
MTRIAVVQFPGSNCERETCDALRAAGASASIVRWNAATSVWEGFDGFVLPGGFSYEDRVRAGAIAAKHALLDTLAAAADAGKPILGLCNGAQILVEAGLVPGIEPGHVEVALAANGDPRWSGYYCEWVHLRAEPGPGIRAGLGADLIPMPVGHGEGRFTARREVFEDLARRGQIAFRYVTPAGDAAGGFPHNPNASLLDVAGLCDALGRVLALMPHPERAAWLYQVPETLAGAWGRARRSAMGNAAALAGSGPGLEVYTSFVRAARPQVRERGA